MIILLCLTIILSFLAAAAIAAVAGSIFRHPGKHERNWKTARQLYRKLNRIEADSCWKCEHGWLINYLRKIDPFVFEELVLLSLRKDGYRIRRNRRYSGDGGIDGKARMDGKRFLIQCKRYSGYISYQDVREFEKICRKKHREGLFVHTGKTGEASKEQCRNSRVTIISGERLAELILKE